MIKNDKNKQTDIFPPNRPAVAQCTRVRAYIIHDVYVPTPQPYRRTAAYRYCYFLRRWVEGGEGGRNRS